MKRVFYGLDEELFRTDPSVFLERYMKEYVAQSPLNSLMTFNNTPIFDEPVVVFANGDDSLFQSLKTVLGDLHLTPREALEMYVRAKGWVYTSENHMENVSVISYALPIPYETRLSERQTPFGGSKSRNIKAASFNWEKLRRNSA